MTAELREGLVEVPAGLPTFASAGLEPAAETIAGIAADAYDYLRGLLDRAPEARVLVLSEDDWATKGRVPVFGLPNASDGTLVVAGTEAPFWAAFGTMVAAADRAELAAVYGESDGEFHFRSFFDLVAVHEVAHLFHQDAVSFPRLWLQELFANLALHAWAERRRPDQLPTLLTLPRLGARVPAGAVEYGTLEDFERVYAEMSAPNYAWFQFRLQVAAADAYRSGGEAVVRGLFEAFRMDDAMLAARLADVDPILAAVPQRFAGSQAAR